MWKQMSYFAFSLPDRPGELARFAVQLRDAGINLVGLWGYSTGDPGEEPRLSCVAESAEAFRDFARSTGLEVEEGRTFHHRGEDRPGALIDTFTRISDAGINIDAIETVASGDSFGCFIWTDDRHIDALGAVLADAS